jgi:ferredoxin
MKRKIIKIDEKKCNGCGECIPNCPEGALQIIDGKARLISDLFCDGLGVCIGHCPQGAITIEERQAQEYDERKVMQNIIKQGKNVILAHLEHLKDHQQHKYLKEALDLLKEKKIKVDFPPKTGTKKEFCGCPSMQVKEWDKKESVKEKTGPYVSAASQLRQWPVQLMLVPPIAPFLQDADLLIAADCVPFAYANFHQDLLKDKVLLVDCPKLDDVEVYQEKISQIVENNNLKSITYAHMEVPCCFGLIGIIQTAISASGKKIPFKEIVISIRGQMKP